MKLDILKIGLDPLIQFEAIARLQSLKNAAQELGVSAPAITQSLGKLEENLGVHLCERTRASFKLTEAGRRLQLLCTEFKEQLQGYQSFLTEDKEFDGQLSIGVIDNFFNETLSAAMEKTVKRFPKMKLNLQVHSAQEVQALVANGEVDVGLGIFNQKLSQLSYRIVGQETIGHFISEAHPLWSKSDVKASDVGSYAKTWVDIINRNRIDLDREIFSQKKKQIARISSYANNLNAAVYILGTGTSIVPVPVEYLASRRLNFKYRSLNTAFPLYQLKQELSFRHEITSASPAAKYFLELIPKIKV